MNLFNVFIGLAVLLMTLLAINISRLRIKEQVANGDGGNRAIQKAIRAHMNTLEHTLPFALALYVLHVQSIGADFFGFLAFGFLILRVLHAYSMMNSILTGRQITAALTYLFEVTACITILLIELQG